VGTELGESGVPQPQAPDVNPDSGLAARETIRESTVLLRIRWLELDLQGHAQQVVLEAFQHV
jgi:hypothetical protein